MPANIIQQGPANEPPTVQNVPENKPVPEVKPVTEKPKEKKVEADEGGRMAVQMKEDSIKTASKLVTQSNIIQKKSSFVIKMITDEDLGARADQADAARTPFVFDPTTITNMERPTPTSDDTDIARKLSIWPELRVKRNEKISLQTGEYEASTGFDLDSYSGDRGPGEIGRAHV